MKKLVSLILMCFVILVSISSNVYPVKAAATTPTLPAEVMFGAVVQKSGGYYGSVYSVRQSLYKRNNNPEARPSFFTGYTAVSSTLCNRHENYNDWGVVNDLLCSYVNTDVSQMNIMNNKLAYFSMTANGDLTVYASADVRINKLNIYYSIAGLSNSNKTSTILLYCKDGDRTVLCDRAKLVNSANTSKSGNWVSEANNGKNMSFAENNLEQYGFKVETNTTGARQYSGYNVISHMSKTAKSLALKYGAYVIVTMSLIHTTEDGDVEYFINTPITDMPNRPEFTDIAYKTSNNEAKNIKTFSNVQYNASDRDASQDSTYKARMTDMNSSGAHVDKYAALISKVDDVYAKHGGIEEFLNMFDSLIKPIIIIGLGLLLIVKGTSLIITIVKSSDEPEVRRESIKHLVTLFISVFVIMGIIWFMKDIIEILQTLISETEVM